MANTRRNVVWIVVGFLVIVVAVITTLTLLGPMLAGPPQACTMIGCVNTLTIRFEGFQPERYRVEISTPDRETYRFECPEPGASGVPGFSTCNTDGVTLSDVSPEDITVKVSWEGGTKTETFHPTYSISQPNGPQCEPTCNISTITMMLP